MQDLTGKTTGSSYTAAQFVEFQTELKTVIANEGIALSSGDLTQVAKALSTISASDFYTATGTFPGLALTSIGSRQPLRAYTDGLIVRFRSSDISPLNASGGSGLRVNVDGLGEKETDVEDATADAFGLLAGDISLLADATLRYDLGRDLFVLLNPQAPRLADGYIRGGRVSRADANDVIIAAIPGIRSFQNIAQGSKSDTTSRKQFDVTYASSGSGTGGGYPLTTLGARVVSTWYRFFSIFDFDNPGTLDHGWDTSALATSLLTDSGFLAYRQIGWHRTLSGDANALENVWQDPYDLNRFVWAVPPTSFDDTPSGASQLITLDAPPNTIADVTLTYDGSAHSYVQISPTDAIIPDPAASASVHQASRDSDSAPYTVNLQIPVDSISQIRMDSDSNAGNLLIQTFGYRYYRGTYTDIV